MSRRQSMPVKPKKVKGQLNLRTEYYKRELYQMVTGVFDCEVPDDWDYGYFINTLLRYGVVAITDSPIGVKPFKCTTYGINYMNNPTNVEITTPIFAQNLSRTIGKDCELIFLDRYYWSNTYYTILPVIDIYADLLALADVAISVNLMNSKLAHIAEAETKAQAETIKAVYDDAMDGNPLVVYRGISPSSNGLNVLFNNLKQNLIAGDLQDIKRTIINDLLTRFGVDNANTDKKERLITNEVDSNRQELICNTAVWAKNLNIQLKKVHKMFPELKGKFDIKLPFREELIKKNESERNDNAVERTKPGETKPV